ncbi:peptidyl-prolyl cis-trans isomerase B (cyclophilin B) [Lacibacter cauensis]|uniref:peptidylprolyl isomerase n=1 Tax=Lacibacter cauensis TaxID=510947 RepID=A0A562SQY2_9BACT|nr:peptidylprolyl isomerase [Lacibacter cauensis]TWI83543.1 peptidyl-prolyl cis-trans isomerase B (cyclophilin B) [Lacibacter cauensis]
MKYVVLLLCVMLALTADARNRKVKIVTSKGTIVVKLSDKTPLHRNNFVKLVKQKYYNGILFHRVIKEFMIQAGDDSTKNPVPGKRYGSGGLSYKIPAEFDSSLFHKRGVLAAARDNNPEKASSGSHFYIVQGKKFTDSTLNEVEVKRMGGRKIPERYRAVYKSIGGAPHLDQNYTVFGEVVKGMQVVDTIAQMERDQYDRPKEDVRIIRMKLKRKFLFF